MIYEKNPVHARARTDVICVETRKPPYSTLPLYHSEVDLSDIERDGDLEPLIANLKASKSALLEGQRLYDLVDRKALIRLNLYANGVSVLPSRVWIY